MKRLAFALLLCFSFVFAHSAAAEETLDLRKALALQYLELASIKGKGEFVTHGFGPGYPRANEWMKISLALRTLAEQKKATRIAQGVSALMELGDAYMQARRSGFKTLGELVLFEDSVYRLRLQVEDSLKE